MRTSRLPTVASIQPANVEISNPSLWRDRAGDLFSDARAMRVGDVVTVTISMKDKAEFDNSSARSRDSKLNLQTQLGYAIGTAKTGTASVNGSGESTTSTTGTGTVTRAETIELRLAATVADILPNGNLVVSGQQEVQMNYEIRVLNVAGIVRPRDIATDNTVPYDRISEARISYGGRGRIMEVAQPGVAQQIFDILTPF